MSTTKDRQIAEFIELASDLDSTQLFILWRHLKAGDPKGAERELTEYTQYRNATAGVIPE